MTQPQRDLVIVMAGDRSLHTGWSEGRDFDLWVIYYGDSREIAESYRAGCDRFWARKGLKIELVRSVLIDLLHFQEKFDFSRYRYVFMPDDDIDFEGGAAAIHGLFSTAEALAADVFQPAVKNDLVSFAATRVLEGAVCHAVNWIENMMPGYRSDLFVNAYLAGIHALEYMKSGWGTELIAVKLAEAQLGRGLRAYVIDSCPAVHTRPVGSNSRVHEVGKDEGFLVPQLHYTQLQSIVGFRTVEGARAQMEAPKPLPRNQTIIELYMQKVRHARKLWSNLCER